MRAFAVALALLAGCEDDDVPKPKPPPPTAAQTAAAATKKRDDCRDACEQHNIVAAGSDAELRECRARCDGQNPPPPHEVPRSISRAPAVSRSPAVRPR